MEWKHPGSPLLKRKFKIVIGRKSDGETFVGCRSFGTLQR
jgi:hypothetical protein